MFFQLCMIYKTKCLLIHEGNFKKNDLLNPIVIKFIFICKTTHPSGNCQLI